MQFSYDFETEEEITLSAEEAQQMLATEITPEERKQMEKYSEHSVLFDFAAHN